MEMSQYIRRFENRAVVGFTPFSKGSKQVFDADNLWYPFESRSRTEPASLSNRVEPRRVWVALEAETME